MELCGEVRCGYLVEGLSGMQFALPEAVDILRALRSDQQYDHEPLLINASDPTNPFGGPVRVQGITTQPARLPANWIAFHRGNPILLIETSGARLTVVGEPPHTAPQHALRQFVELVRLPESMASFKSVTVLQCNGTPAAASSLAPLLRALGFRRDANHTMRYDGYV